MSDRSGPMTCPVDGTTLVMSARQNIEIDYCPTCRGVWLDRGELDKIIERSLSETAAAAPPPAAAAAPPPPPNYVPPPQPQYAPPPHQPHYGDPYRGHHGGHHYPHKRRKSFLEELFD
ncbi:MAG TPA: zf-TFIIB domain-containing protein [Allosphingosinicella sp.]